MNSRFYRFARFVLKEEEVAHRYSAAAPGFSLAARRRPHRERLEVNVRWRSGSPAFRKAAPLRVTQGRRLRVASLPRSLLARARCYFSTASVGGEGGRRRRGALRASHCWWDRVAEFTWKLRALAFKTACGRSLPSLFHLCAGLSLRCCCCCCSSLTYYKLHTCTPRTPEEEASLRSAASLSSASCGGSQVLESALSSGGDLKLARHGDALTTICSIYTVRCGKKKKNAISPGFRLCNKKRKVAAKVAITLGGR